MYKMRIHKNLMLGFQFSEFQEAFQLFDSRGDGKIDVSLVGDALRALGQNPTETEVKKFTHQLKHDDRISFEVFLPIYQVFFFHISILQFRNVLSKNTLQYVIKEP